MRRTIFTSGLPNVATNYLLEHGFNVVLGAHSQEQADAMTNKVPEAYREQYMAFFQQEETMGEKLREIEDRFGGLHAVVQGIGILENGSFQETSPEEFEKIVASHIYGVYRTIKSCLPTLLKYPAPRIINFTCIEGKCGKFDWGVGSAVGKGALVALTRVIALEYAGIGLTANCIAIGAMRTLKERSPERIRELEQQIPVGRIAEASDIGPVIEFLAGEASGYITGDVINVSGGAYMD